MPGQARPGHARFASIRCSRWMNRKAKTMRFSPCVAMPALAPAADKRSEFWVALLYFKQVKMILGDY